MYGSGSKFVSILRDDSTMSTLRIAPAEMPADVMNESFLLVGLGTAACRQFRGLGVFPPAANSSFALVACRCPRRQKQRLPSA